MLEILYTNVSRCPFKFCDWCISSRNRPVDSVKNSVRETVDRYHWWRIQRLSLKIVDKVVHKTHA